jgi:hypothetical protein
MQARISRFTQRRTMPLRWEKAGAAHVSDGDSDVAEPWSAWLLEGVAENCAHF